MLGTNGVHNSMFASSDMQVKVAMLAIDWEGDTREMSVAVEGDNDLQVIFKGNDEHGYVYVVRNTGSARRPHARAAVCESRVNCRSLGVEGGELPASRLRLGGDAIEKSDDDEISVASEDAGDEETTKEDDAGNEQAAEKQCGDGNKRKVCTNGNDVNDNVWPRSGMEA
ncbi:hypothetical protein Cgig2_007069 [Carnegiea gigantea]|uniref:Uncharacterized protein n=1 Tax=Carnegiea gigantea TaxID=171969 RepID=A0A9Q1KA95_9CARY|nr:hypothetical protein Cgig2_007069 [Carnegiea gigantea]